MQYQIVADSGREYTVKADKERCKLSITDIKSGYIIYEDDHGSAFKSHPDHADYVEKFCKDFINMWEAIIKQSKEKNHV